MATQSPFLNLPKELRLLVYESLYPLQPSGKLISLNNDISEMATQSPFLNLPKELRFLIYESLYPLQPSGKLISLNNDTSPPTNSLPLTCRQIHHETSSLYRLSFRTFWTTEKFLLIHETQAPETSRDRIITLPLREMQHITNLTLIATSDNPEESFTAYLVHPNGGWRIVSHDGETTFRRYRKWLWRKDAKSESIVVPTKAAWDGHGNEEQLNEACERATCGVPRVNQVLHVCGLELVDLSGARW